MLYFYENPINIIIHESVVFSLHSSAECCFSFAIDLKKTIAVFKIFPAIAVLFHKFYPMWG